MGMSANTPTDIVFSFEGFRKRGGMTDHHEDGFGIAFFENNGVRLLQDNKPSAYSPVGDLIRNYPIKSLSVIAHIRRATQGKLSLANTHPFVRELWGQYWVFAHNGQLSNFQKISTFYKPVGTTDSEHAFCYILSYLKEHFPEQPEETVLFETITRLCREIAEFGMFNCLLSNGQWQFCFSTSLLHFITRKAPFGVANLIDAESAIDFGEVTNPDDVVTVMATTPLTDNEAWKQLAIGEAITFKNGISVFNDVPHKTRKMPIEEGIRLAKEIGACD